ncbi:MAG: hypothetical protein BXU00_02385 [Candidatus Nanoclepta minutus]|uniref:Radical SAM core domain-containing protein n=1 Tax=Candidatus Nanoclepta minutus TaxID=1940235 RepID=A0A397WN78_9ARCH|nr:MAG: hypothetical protein BXU00_02385 [Candidatus Nanoclepta minutus]
MVGTKYISYAYKEGDKTILSTVTENGKLINVIFSEGEFKEFLEGELREAGFLYGDKEIVYEKPTLHKAQIEITEECNLKCPFCYVGNKAFRSMPIDKALELLEKLKSLGVKIIEISGGEPFLYKDLDVFLSRAKDIGFYIVLFTNGTVIKYPLLKYVDRLQISYDGPLYLHKKYRGVEINIKEIVERCKEFNNNLRVDIATVLYKDTSVYDMYNLYRELKDVNFDYWGLSPPVPTGYAKELTIEDLKEIYLKILDLLYLLKKVDKRFYENKILFKNKRKYICPAGESYIYITEDFKVKPCPLIDRYIGDFWEGFKPKKLEEFKIYEEICRNCEGCLFPCPAYRFYFSKSTNPWCKTKFKKYRIFENPLFIIYYDFFRKDRNWEFNILKNLIYELENRSIIVDFGCGIGNLTYMIAEEFKDSKIIGIDSSSILIEHAKSRYNLKNLDFVCEDALKFIKKINTIDIAIFWWASIIGYDYPWKTLLRILRKKCRHVIIDLPPPSSDDIIDVQKEKYRIRVITKGSFNFVDIFEEDELKLSTVYIFHNYSTSYLNNIFEKIGYKIKKFLNIKNRRIWVLSSN